jgi:hypothetical protein
VRVNPRGDPGWDESPLGIRIPDDARDLERDVLAYHREQRALRRRRALRRVFPAGAGVMPLIASILAVCLIAGMMLSVFTISPGETTRKPTAPVTTTSASAGGTSGRAGHATPSASPGTRPASPVSHGPTPNETPNR